MIDIYDNKVRSNKLSRKSNATLNYNETFLLFVSDRIIPTLRHLHIISPLVTMSQRGESMIAHLGRKGFSIYSDAKTRDGSNCIPIGHSVGKICPKCHIHSASTSA